MFNNIKVEISINFLQVSRMMIVKGLKVKMHLIMKLVPISRRNYLVMKKRSLLVKRTRLLKTTVI